MCITQNTHLQIEKIFFSKYYCVNKIITILLISSSKLDLPNTCYQKMSKHENIGALFWMEKMVPEKMLFKSGENIYIIITNNISS